MTSSPSYRYITVHGDSSERSPESAAGSSADEPLGSDSQTGDSRQAKGAPSTQAFSSTADEPQAQPSPEAIAANRARKEALRAQVKEWEESDRNLSGSVPYSGARIGIIIVAIIALVIFVAVYMLHLFEL